jgi:hypothetical protein
MVGEWVEICCVRRRNWVGGGDRGSKLRAVVVIAGETKC